MNYVCCVQYVHYVNYLNCVGIVIVSMCFANSMTEYVGGLEGAGGCRGRKNMESEGYKVMDIRISFYYYYLQHVYITVSCIHIMV